MSKLHLLKPEKIFAFMAIFFGLPIIFLTPPFQSPDEINHFYRIYQVSEGNLFAEKINDRVGGYLPSSLKEITKPFLCLRWNANEKTNYDSIQKAQSILLNPQRREFYDFQNTALYSFVSYLPQSIFAFILRKINLNPLHIFYLLRVFSLLFWTLSMFYVLKCLPAFKWLFLLLALLPMSLFINLSVTADTITNVLSFAFIATVLKIKFSEQKFSKINFITLLALILLLGSAKYIYGFLTLLVFIIPISKFENKKNYFFQLGTLAVVSIAMFIFWSSLNANLFISYENYNPLFRVNDGISVCSNIKSQLHYLNSDKLNYFKVFFFSLCDRFDMYIKGYVGTFGWIDFSLPTWMIFIWYILIAMLALSNKEENFVFSIRSKLCITLAFIILLVALFFSIYISWDCVGDRSLSVIQGKYLIPILPIFWLLLSRNIFKMSSILKTCVFVFLIVSLAYTCVLIYSRYYIPGAETTRAVKC